MNELQNRQFVIKAVLSPVRRGTRVDKSSMTTCPKDCTCLEIGSWLHVEHMGVNKNHNEDFYLRIGNQVFDLEIDKRGRVSVTPKGEI